MNHNNTIRVPERLDHYWLDDVVVVVVVYCVCMCVLVAIDEEEAKKKYNLYKTRI